MTAPLTIEETAIPGLLVVTGPVHGDARGWFTEVWQRQKMTALGLPDFGPVQHNVSYNQEAGTIRGLHAEPWDKFVTVVRGEAFGAWADLREGESFGRTAHVRLRPGTAVFVPRGVANGYQTLEPSTAYSYLVNDHWSPQARDSYTYVNVADDQLGIPWPLPLDEARMSAADREHPALGDVTPFQARKGVVILGASGQLGRALREVLPDARALTRADVDLADPASVAGLDLDGVDVVINAAAFTAVDAAETPEGRAQAWATNVTGVAALVERCRAAGTHLVHVSSDYVFDGTREAHSEEEPFTPLGVYGQTKAAGDALVATLPRHTIVRTSWVVGDGKNFVATMAGLAERGIRSTVVDDQVGRLTFTRELAEAIVHLVGKGFMGTVNVTCDGPPASWADVAKAVYEATGHDPDDVTPVSTQAYMEGRGSDAPTAPRPRFSTLDLSRLTASGFTPGDWRERVRDYLAASGD